MQGDFITDVREIRRRARQHLESGAVTDNYQADRQTVINLLNEALATEIVCVLRYKQHYVMAKGIDSESVANEFLEHARDEQDHADRLAERITQLGGKPDMDPAGLLSRSHTEYSPAGPLSEMIKENLVAERIVIDSYRSMIQYLGSKDSTSRRLLEDILAKEEEHAEDLSNLLT